MPERPPPSRPVPPRARAASPQLPAWPVSALFAAFPIWWLLGLASFAVALCAIPMAAFLIQRRRIAVPPGFALWALFLVWVAAASLELQGATKFLGFAVRFVNMAGAGVLFVYIYNARVGLSRRRVLSILAIFFAFVVFGGFLGVLLPTGSFSTPVEQALPLSIRSNSYVHALVHPAFAEVQQPYGSPRAFRRPSAPFPYTNSWGCNMALLLPLAVAAYIDSTSRRTRFLLATVMVLAAVPAFVSLNRGLFLALGVGLLYVALRLVFRGHLMPLVGLIAAVATATAVAVASGVVSSLNDRLQYSQSNAGRATVYRESFEGALRSPIFGYGAPRPSDTVDVAVGSQGLVWTVMFSYGFVALACFLGCFVCATWTARRAAGPTGLWIHSVLVIGLVSFVYYGYDGPQLAVIMAATALAVRDADLRATARPARPVSRGRTAQPVR